MASILRFDNWQNSDGTSIATTDASGNISFAGSGAGKILQVVSTTKTDTFSASVALGAYSTAAISTTITPSSTASKVLILAQVSVSAAADVGDAVLYRGGSALTGATGDAAGSRRRGTSGSSPTETAERLVPTIPIMYLDSPNTTSATTYDVRLGHNQNGTSTVYMNRTDSNPDYLSIARPISSLTLIEVSA